MGLTGFRGSLRLGLPLLVSLDAGLGTVWVAGLWGTAWARTKTWLLADWPKGACKRSPEVQEPPGGRTSEGILLLWDGAKLHRSCGCCGACCTGALPAVKSKLADAGSSSAPPAYAISYF